MCWFKHLYNHRSLGFSHTKVSDWRCKKQLFSKEWFCKMKWLVDERDQWWMARLVQADEKAHHNDEQKSLSERRRFWALSLGDGFQLQKTTSGFTSASQEQKAWAVVDKRKLLKTRTNVTWSDEARFLLRHTDDRVRIWYHQIRKISNICCWKQCFLCSPSPEEMRPKKGPLLV